MPRPEVTAQSLESIAEPVCRAHGVELVQLRITTQRGDSVLQVIIDRERAGGDVEGSGVTLEDCTQVSRDLSTALDLADELFTSRYRLEVSSPGLDRPLVKLRDFERFTGREAKIQLKAPLAGRRKFQGKLRAVDGDVVEIEQDGTPVRIPLAEIDRASLVHRF